MLRVSAGYTGYIYFILGWNGMISLAHYKLISLNIIQDAILSLIFLPLS